MLIILNLCFREGGNQRQNFHPAGRLQQLTEAKVLQHTMDFRWETLHIKMTWDQVCKILLLCSVSDRPEQPRHSSFHTVTIKRLVYCTLGVCSE